MSAEFHKKYYEAKGIATTIVYIDDMSSNMLFKSEDVTKDIQEEWGLFLNDDDIPRDDPVLINMWEQYGSKITEHGYELKIVYIPEDVKWHIANNDHTEWVQEKSRSWS